MRAETGAGFDEKRLLRLSRVRENWKFCFHFFCRKNPNTKFKGNMLNPFLVVTHA